MTTTAMTKAEKDKFIDGVIEELESMAPNNKGPYREMEIVPETPKQKYGLIAVKPEKPHRCDLPKITGWFGRKLLAVGSVFRCRSCKKVFVAEAFANTECWFERPLTNWIIKGGVE